MAKRSREFRTEPRLHGAAEAPGIRLSREDRIGGPPEARSRQDQPKRQPRRRSERREPRFDVEPESRPTRGRGGGGGRRTAPPRRRLTLGRLLRRGFYWGAVLGVWAFIVGAGILIYTAVTMPDTVAWAIPERPPNIQIVSADGELIANRGTGGEAVRLAELPAYLPAAVVAMEDRRFYYHLGLDPIGLTRALYLNWSHGEVVQGGSTLTQQLAKNFFLDFDQTLQRKLQEAVLAVWLELKYSKNEILEMYLNRVYFGGGAYGVDAAARRFFGKPATEVDLAEAAMLAGVLSAPSRYSPTRDVGVAQARAALVLRVMADAGIITPEEAAEATAHPAVLVAPEGSGSENYVADWVLDLLPSYVGAVDGDIIVVTTIDARVQDAAADALASTLAAEGGANDVSQGAVVAIGNDGAVRALVGGRDYAESQFDRALNAHRQPGSAFKPFVYLAALEAGYTPDTMVVDEPVTIGDWSPRNYSRDYLGPVTLTTALADSLNTVAARLTADLGAERVVATAHRLGILSDLHTNPSIALGTGEVTPFELTSAYVPFANGGYGVIPYVIEAIHGEDRVLYQRSGSGLGRVVGDTAIGAINLMLETALADGTGHNAALSERPAAGKTGTSQDLRDAWFVGYTADLTAGVWLGNDDGSPTGSTGGAVSARVWQRFMAAATAEAPMRDLPGVAAARAASEAARAAPPLAPDGPSQADRDVLDQLLAGVGRT